MTSAPHWQPEFDRLVAELKEPNGVNVRYVVAVIPRTPCLEDASVVDAGGWPVRFYIEELPNEHRDAIDFLIDEAVSQWPTT